MRRSRRAGGRTVEAVRPGYAIPLDALVIRPRAFARVVGAAQQFDRLRHGTALLSRTSARLRGLVSGDRITLVGGLELRIAGIVDDDAVRFAELIVTRADIGGGRETTRQVFAATTDPKRVARIFSRKGAVRVGVLSANQRATPRLVARPLETKAQFGEFAVGLPYGSDWIRIDPLWVGRNIVTRGVPILGSVTCNRRIFPPLRRALRSLQRRGLSRVVQRADYAGCFAPRRIPGSGSLSLHAWGLAIDINASANPRLGESRQDRRLVQAMEDAGFTWGGRWPTVPDPMHFELHP
jgi:D-alanyl-D-alanine carboxypeptidase